MTTKTLMILQAGQSQIRIIETARKMGLKVISTDKNKNAPGLKVADIGESVDVVNKSETLKLAKKYKVDGILPGGDVSLPTAAYVAEEMALIGLSPEQANVATNKELYYERFRKNNIPYPTAGIVEDIDECYRLSKDIGFPVIIKPTTSFGGSRGVKRINNINEVEEAFMFAKKSSQNGRMLIEEFLDGEEHTIESIVHDGINHVLAISDKERIKESYCLATSLNYPSQLPGVTIMKINDIAQKVSDALGLKNWITHLEVITYGDKIKVIDFGARGGGAGYIPTVIVPNMCGVNMMEEFIRILIGERPQNIQEKFIRGIIYRFFTPAAGKITEIKGIEEVKAMDDVIDIHLYVKEGDIIHPLTTQLERCGYFVVTGKSFNDAMIKAKEVENKVKIVTKSIVET